MKMHFKHRIGATLVGLGLFTAPVVVPAFAQQQITPTPTSGQVTPAAASQDTSTTSEEDTIEEEEAQQELSASDAEIEELVNEDIIEEAPPTEEELAEESEDRSSFASKINYRERALAKAKPQIGYKEGFNNHNKFSQYFGKNHQSWCADFVSWAFDSTGNKNKKLPWKNPSAVASILAWAKKDAKHRLVTTPKPGDVFIIRKIDKNGKVLVSHTGLVWQVAKDGKTFRTIEGNSSNKVSSNWKPVSTKYKFVRIPNSLFPL
jgi:hypothetical protein